MSLIIETTPWDDAYFNLKTARVTLTEELTSIEEKQLEEKSREFDLVVIDNSRSILRNDRRLAALRHNYLCDVQVRFKLMIPKVQVEETVNVSIQNNMPPSEQILDISRLVYHYSRFKMDPFLEAAKAQAIYIKWCQDAFNQLEKYFAIYTQDGIIQGYILFHNQEVLTIELIGVSIGKQGLGIGSDMIKQLVCYCQEKNINEIRVGTQANNREAIQFYQKHGFKLEEIHTIYHYWPNKQ